MNVWLAVVLGWLFVAVAVGVVIGAVVRRRDRQQPKQPQQAPLSRTPRGNVDVTTAVPAVRRSNDL